MEMRKEEKVPTVNVPASKSILLRALLLSALCGRPTKIRLMGALCDDTAAMIDCLRALRVSIREEGNLITVFKPKGSFPMDDVLLDVRESAVTARLLAAAITVCGGSAVFQARQTLFNRPMRMLGQLKEAGASIVPFRSESSFPFRLVSHGLKMREFTVDTDESTQYASAILLSAAAADAPVSIRITGTRRTSGYLRMTLSLLREFGVPVRETQDVVIVDPQFNPPDVFLAENDLSSACYFCSLALLAKTRILIAGANRSRIQPDDKFLSLLTERGLSLTESGSGLLADGRNAASFAGFHGDFSAFSDQTLTAAALAPFAATPSKIFGVSHIRFQECNRLQAIKFNLDALGISADLDEDGVVIRPGTARPAKIQTFGDHRVAMAFALTGFRTKISIDNPQCCKKTFPDYFEELNKLHLFDISFD